MSENNAYFAYDDAFKTMLVECNELVIPLINEFFGENYTGDERIIRKTNEHFVERERGSDKRITDSSLEIITGKTGRKYHLECESSTKGSVLIRMFEYDAQIALDDGVYKRYRLTLDFPHSGILFLRSAKRIPDEMSVIIRTPGGEISYPVKVMRESDYTIDDIFEKKLYFLIPFYIFNLESKLKEYDEDEKKREELVKIYSDILERLENLVKTEKMSSFSEHLIKKLSNRVTSKIAHKYKNVKEGIGDIMGGRVLDLDIIRIKHEEREEGRKEERKNTERERNRAIAAENRINDAENRASDAENRANKAENRVRELEALLAKAGN